MMSHKIEAAPEKPITKDTCCHYWLIESANGPTSRGVCKFCGAEKQFNNSLLDSWWEGDLPMLSELPGLLEIEPDWERYNS